MLPRLLRRQLYLLRLHYLGTLYDVFVLWRELIDIFVTIVLNLSVFAYV